MGSVDYSGQIVNGQYMITKRLGGGSFGDVYEAVDAETQEQLAAKMEVLDIPSPQLGNEYSCYRILEGESSIPSVFGLYEFGKTSVMIMERMGPSLESLFKRCGKKFSLKTTLMIADQVLRVIEYVHSCGILHRDIKPQNFVIGRGAKSKTVSIIDFGVSTQYLDLKTKEHKIFTMNNGLIGTPYYVSANTHLGHQQSRRDDLESIAYMFIRFLKGTLPWMKVRCQNAEERNEEITKLKVQTTIEALCEGLPREFMKFLKYTKELNYDDTPQYGYIRSIFRNLFLKMNFVNDGVFDWDEEAPIHRPLPGIFLCQGAAGFLRAHERVVRPKKSKVLLPCPRNFFMCCGKA